jgi:hypothetical protein
MSNGLKSLSHLPEVDIKRLRERKLLEAELLTLAKQVRNFGQLRDRFLAEGGDANAYYRKIQARRLQILAMLKSKEPHTSSVERIPRVPIFPGSPPRSNPSSAPATIIRPPFGTSGYVQMAPASEGVNVVPQGQFPISGEIVTVPGSYPGAIGFQGSLSVGPEETTGAVDPTINYFWLHNWTYLVPFPAPAVTSYFTYSFDVYAQADVLYQGLDGMVMSFVSVGETATLTTGENVVANIDAGWPLMQDLDQSGPSYNGHYGEIDGSVTVQRSFMVTGGHVPGVAIVVGAVGALAMMSNVNFAFAGQTSGIDIGSGYGFGHVAYSYDPEIVAK